MWGINLKRTLIRNTLISLLVLILIIGIFSYYRIKDTLIEEAFADITESFDGYIYMLDSDPDTDINQSTKDFGVYSGNRITVIDSNTGEVLGDSYNEISEMDNHLYRDEVSDARLYGEGSSIRHSRTENVDFIYYAKPYDLAGLSVIVRTSTPLYSVKESYNSIALTMFFASVFAAAIAFLISYRYNRKVIQPIESITEFAHSISKGHYGKSVYINSYEEVQKLSIALNKLSKSLRKSFDKLSTRNATLEAILHSLSQGILVCDVDGNVKYTNDKFSEIIKLKSSLSKKNIYHNIFDENLYNILEEIKSSKGDKLITKNNVQFSDDTYRNYSGRFIRDKKGKKKGILLVVEDITNIRKLERMRSVFVSNVTHELKTPITCISGYTQTLLNGAVEDKENAYKFLGIINDESQRLNLLIDDILILSGLENQKKPAEKEQVNLIEISNEVIELIQQKYPDKNAVEFKIDYDENTSYEMMGDRNKLKQVIINLVDNSAKHTDEGHITIGLAKDATSLILSVSDTGIGIDKKHHSRLFERFYRVDKHRSRDAGGTGLGLSIVKHITLMHDGEISVDSSYGHGTTINIKFPM